MLTNTVVATITAYCACIKCCGPNANNITANGKTPKPNHTIAASRRFPFGSIVQVEGRTYVVEDRLAKRFDSRFDIFFSRHKDAQAFGIKRNVSVTIITK